MSVTVSAGSNESSLAPPLLWWVNKLPVKHKELTRVLKEWKTGCRTHSFWKLESLGQFSWLSEHVKAFLSRFIMLERTKFHKMKDSSLKVLNVSFTDKDVCGVIFLVWCWCPEEFNLLVWSTTWCVENKAQNYTIMCLAETINVCMWK